MNAMIPIIYVQFLILMGPALVITASLIRKMKRENLRDRRNLAELKLARLHGIARSPKIKTAA